MALTKTLIETKDNFTGKLIKEDAYWQVETLTGTKAEFSFTVSVSACASSPTLAVVRYTFVPKIDGPNFFQQAYEYLKTLPEFSDAVDC